MENDPEILVLLQALVQQGEAMAAAVQRIAQENAALKKTVERLQRDVSNLIQRGKGL